MADRTSRCDGFSMLEVLIAIVIASIGLLGMAGLSARSMDAEYESYQRAQALILLEDMVDKINANRKAAGCYAFTDPASGAPALGTASTWTPACTAYGTSDQQQRAVSDMTDWNAKLVGASEQQAGNATGAMQGARGCVTFDPTSNTYQISVVWQGIVDTVSPTSMDPSWNCAANLYGAETKRRLVAVTLGIANLR